MGGSNVGESKLFILTCGLSSQQCCVVEGNGDQMSQQLNGHGSECLWEMHRGCRYWWLGGKRYEGKKSHMGGERGTGHVLIGIVW